MLRSPAAPFINVRVHGCLLGGVAGSPGYRVGVASDLPYCAGLLNSFRSDLLRGTLMTFYWFRGSPRALACF